MEWIEWSSSTGVRHFQQMHAYSIIRALALLLILQANAAQAQKQGEFIEIPDMSGAVFSIKAARSKEMTLQRIVNGSADRLVDKLLKDLFTDDRIQRLLDPLFIQAAGAGPVALRNLTISGLLSLRRTGRAELKVEDDQFVVDLRCGLFNVLMDTFYAAKMARIGINGYVQVFTPRFDFNIRLAMRGMRLHLERFSVLDAHIQVNEFSGTTALLDRMGRWMLNRVLSGFRNNVRSRIEGLTKNFIKDALFNFDASQVLVGLLTALK